ncbi:hypothetical protein GCM10018965_069200 [Nonomuraea roseola]
MRPGADIDHKTGLTVSRPYFRPVQRAQMTGASSARFRLITAERALSFLTNISSRGDLQPLSALTYKRCPAQWAPSGNQASPEIRCPPNRGKINWQPRSEWKITDPVGRRRDHAISRASTTQLSAQMVGGSPADHPA